MRNPHRRRGQGGTGKGPGLPASSAAPGAPAEGAGPAQRGGESACVPQWTLVKGRTSTKARSRSAGRQSVCGGAKGAGKVNHKRPLSHVHIIATITGIPKPTFLKETFSRDLLKARSCHSSAQNWQNPTVAPAFSLHQSPHGLAWPGRGPL